MLARIDEQQQQIDKLRGVRLQDPALDITAGPSLRRSSVAESEVPSDGARMIDGGPGYPVDGIKEQISCELHQKVKNISLKVAVGCALPCPPVIISMLGRDAHIISNMNELVCNLIC